MSKGSKNRHGKRREGIKTSSVALHEDLITALDEIAKSDRRSRNNLIDKILRDAVKRHGIDLKE